MCGISGVLTDATVDPRVVEQAARLQQHRGPDNFQSCVFNGGCFCHNRLSLIDLTERSNQPIKNDRGILVFNGEIYNYKELSQKHALPDTPFSDSLTLSKLLEHHDTSILPELNGMFAFAFFNTQKRTLLMARDRFGIKPLYHAQFKETFCFASEMKTLLSLLEATTAYRREDDVADAFLSDCLVYGHTEFGNLPFKSIRELSPGSFIEVNPAIHSNQHTEHRFFSIPEAIHGSTTGSWSSRALNNQTTALDTHLRNSVELHLISDAPLGVLCSGGIDSSLITALAATMTDKVSIYHATVDSGQSELRYAEMVAKRYGLTLNTITMTPDRFRDALVDSIYHLDVPMYHPSDISLYTIAQKAHEDGVKGLLCGEGADELFGGYGWHDIFNRSSARYPLLQKVSKGVDLIYRALRLFRYADQFTPEEFFLHTGNYLPYTTRNTPEFAKRNGFLRNRHSWQLLRDLKARYAPHDSHPELAAFITSNCYGHLSTLLQRNDRMCMQASIESRVPFIENNLIDFALNLDSSWKLHRHQGKYLLKKCAEKYLPHAVIYRKKAGFPVPFEQYSRNVNYRIFEHGFMSQQFDCSLEDIRFFTSSDSSRLFTMLSLEIWGRLFIRREACDSVKELVS